MHQHRYFLPPFSPIGMYTLREQRLCLWSTTVPQRLERIWSVVLRNEWVSECSLQCHLPSMPASLGVGIRVPLTWPALASVSVRWSVSPGSALWGRDRELVLMKSPLLRPTDPVCVCVLLRCVQLFVTPRTVARQAPLCVGSSRQEYWSV